MATPKQATRKTAATKSSQPTDAIALLTADHKEVKQLFKEFDQLVEAGGSDEDKQQLAQRICATLTVHATAEEEIFYPAARDALGEDEDLIDEAAVEHASAKDLIAQIEESSPDEELYDAKVKVLGEYIEHHVKEEEGEIFPKTKKAGLDFEALGEQLRARKEELKSEESEEI